MTELRLGSPPVSELTGRVPVIPLSAPGITLLPWLLWSEPRLFWLLLVPDTSAQAILDRLGHKRATLAEFEAEYGPVRPSDDEG